MWPFFCLLARWFGLSCARRDSVWANAKHDDRARLPVVVVVPSPPPKKKTPKILKLFNYFCCGAQVDFFDFGETNLGAIKWLRQGTRWLLFVDVILFFLTFINWKDISRRVKARRELLKRKTD